MRFDFTTSARAAELFLAFRKASGWTNEEFALAAGGGIHEKTLARLLTTETTFSRDQLLILTYLVAGRLDLSVERLLAYFVDGGQAPRRARDLIVADIHAIKEDDLSRLREKLAQAEGHAAACRMLRSTPPPFFLTDRVMPKFYRWVAAEFPSYTDQRYETMMRHARIRHGRFMLGLGALPSRIDLLISDAQMHRLLHQDLPAAGCSVDELDELCEEWIFNRLQNRNIRIGIFIEANLSCCIRNEVRVHEALVQYDGLSTLKRLNGFSSALWYPLMSPHSGAAEVVMDAASLLENVCRAVPYELDDVAAGEATLRALLSPGTWAYRSANAYLYRAATSN